MLGAPLGRMNGGGGLAAATIRLLSALGLVTLEDLVRRGVTVVETSASHRSFLVSVGNRSRYFVKRWDPVSSHGRTLATELAFYRLAARRPSLVAVAPRCHHASPDGRVLVLDAVGATDAYADGESRGAAFMRSLGRLLARVHSSPPDGPLGPRPWPLEADVEPDVGWMPAPAARFMKEIAGAADLQEGFATLRGQWRDGTLIHGDLRWTNVMADARPSSDGARLHLVDWELACVGDEAWDVGCVVAEVLAARALAGPHPPATPRVPATLGPFLAAYRAERDLDEGALDSLVERSARLAGARLVQTIAEFGHFGATDLAAVEPALRPVMHELLTDPSAVAASLGALATNGTSR